MKLPWPGGRGGGRGSAARSAGPRRRGRWNGRTQFPTVLRPAPPPAQSSSYAASPAPTVAGIRNAFDKQKEIEYAIESISGKDLEITKENDKVVIRFAYEKEIELIKPVYLLVKYEGQSK